MVSQVESFEQAKQSNATAKKCASSLSDFTPTSQIDTEEMEGEGCLMSLVSGQLCCLGQTMLLLTFFELRTCVFVCSSTKTSLSSL